MAEMHITFVQKEKKLKPLLPQFSFFKIINCSQILAWTGELSLSLFLEMKLKLNDSARRDDLSLLVFSFSWTPSGNWKDLNPGGQRWNGVWKVLTMWPSVVGSPARCRRAWRSCAPRRYGLSEGEQSPGPFDWDAPGTWYVQTPSSAPEEPRRGGVTGQDQIKMGETIAVGQ